MDNIGDEKNATNDNNMETEPSEEKNEDADLDNNTNLKKNIDDSNDIMTGHINSSSEHPTDITPQKYSPTKTNRGRGRGRMRERRKNQQNSKKD